jgi:hypothetical protein
MIESRLFLLPNISIASLNLPPYWYKLAASFQFPDSFSNSAYLIKIEGSKREPPSVPFLLACFLESS